MPSDLDERSGHSKRKKWTGRIIEFIVPVVLIWSIFSIAGRVLPYVAIRQIAELTNTKIDTSSVRFRFDGSVSIKNLVIRPQTSKEYDDSILNAETVRVRFSVGSLLILRPRVKEIFVDDFVMRAVYDSNSGQWNLSALKLEMPSSGGGRLPLVWLENGMIEYSKAINNRVRVLATAPISVGFRPAKKLIGGYSFDVSGASKQSLEGTAVFGYWQPGRVVLGGRISSKDIPGFERPWTIKAIDMELTYDPNKSCELKAKVKGFSGPPSESSNLFAFNTESVVDKLPFVDALQKFFNRYNPSGTIDIDLKASGNLVKAAESRITATVSCDDATVCDSNFPYKIEHITGQIELTEKSTNWLA